MTEDNRTSNQPRSGSVTFTGNDSGSSKDLVSIRDSQTLSAHDYVASYSGNGTTEATVTLYDEPEGTAAGDAEDSFETIQLSPGDTLVATEIARSDVSDDVVAVVSGNDAEVSVVFGGHIITG